MGKSQIAHTTSQDLLRSHFCIFSARPLAKKKGGGGNESNNGCRNKRQKNGIELHQRDNGTDGEDDKGQE
jgi:hypothetical protein